MKPDGIKGNGTRAVPFFCFFPEEEGWFLQANHSDGSGQKQDRRQMLADGASGIHVVFKTAGNCPYFRKNGENPLVSMTGNKANYFTSVSCRLRR